MQLLKFGPSKADIEITRRLREALALINITLLGHFPGLTYYSETTELYAEYADEIWEMLCEDADAFGCRTIAELGATFNGAKDANNRDQYENLLVWYAAERIAREVVGLGEC